LPRKQAAVPSQQEGPPLLVRTFVFVVGATATSRPAAVRLTVAATATAAATTTTAAAGDRAASQVPS
jgi:hypothetical protein